MAKIVPISLIESIHGKLDKDENFVFSKRYGNTHVWEVEPSQKEPTAAQLAVQSRFAEAASQASADMLDPEKKAEWQDVADASNGKWKTARGAAFASYYAASADFD
jgi:hypothetical protein